jgi:hypothetical protein
VGYSATLRRWPPRTTSAQGPFTDARQDSAAAATAPRHFRCLPGVPALFSSVANRGAALRSRFASPEPAERVGEDCSFVIGVVPAVSDDESEVVAAFPKRSRPVLSLSDGRSLRRIDGEQLRQLGAEQAREGCMLAQRRERLDQPKRAWLRVSRSTSLRSLEMKSAASRHCWTQTLVRGHCGVASCRVADEPKSDTAPRVPPLPVLAPSPPRVD